VFGIDTRTCRCRFTASSSSQRAYAAHGVSKTAVEVNRWQAARRCGVAPSQLRISGIERLHVLHDGMLYILTHDVVEAAPETAGKARQAVLTGQASLAQP
jgi:hypothetical protein